MTQTHRSANTAGVFFRGPNARSTTRTGAPNSDAAGALAANRRPVQRGGRSPGTSQASALSLTYPHSEWMRPASTNRPERISRRPMDQVCSSASARAA